MEIISRKAARKLGLTSYYTGEPCKAGHLDVRRISNSLCATCDRARLAAYRETNREALRARARADYDIDKARAYVAANKEEVARKKREYTQRNAQAIAESRTRYLMEGGHARRMERLRGDPLARLTHTCRSRLSVALARGGYTKASKKTIEIIGCSWEDLKAHIESQFLPGMTWANWGEWHIDHRTPLASAKTEAEVLALCHFKNLQPLWRLDNLRKGRKIVVDALID